jgi:hypothetical protein
VKSLTADGSNIADWGKYTTQTFKSVRPAPDALLLQLDNRHRVLRPRLQGRFRWRWAVKVLCVTLGDSQPGQTGWLTVHREYIVLAILALPGRSIKFRVLADDGHTPILADSSLFAALVQPLPGTWAATVTEGGVVKLGPQRWLEPGFWEHFFDGDPVAVEVYRQEVEALSG